MRLQVDGVSKSFGERTLFRPTDFEVQAGEMVALTGPSGSGKSTLLFIMSGRLLPDSGSIRFVHAGATAPVDPAQVAWIPQGNNLLPTRTVLDNAALGGLGHGLRRSDACDAARRALDLVGISPALHHTAARLLSGGEQQRVAVARALCSGRPMIFADEPTGHLDATNTAAVVEALRAAANDGAGVVVATHDWTVARSCDRSITLDGTSGVAT